MGVIPVRERTGFSVYRRPKSFDFDMVGRKKNHRGNCQIHRGKKSVDRGKKSVDRGKKSVDPRLTGEKSQLTGEKSQLTGEKRQNVSIAVKEYVNRYLHRDNFRLVLSIFLIFAKFSATFASFKPV
jgi:hypothetical protein